MKQLLKQLLAFFHISVTRNQRYDAYTRRIIQETLAPSSNCIDVGCHRGEILDLMIQRSPNGKKYGFEPIPMLVGFLREKYSGDPNVEIHSTALFDREGTTTFQHVVNAPAYSGIRQRKYDGREVTIEEITVQTGRLDSFIPANLKIDLIKIDVEGAEFHVMKGAVETLRRCRPIVVFEFGLGAADFYEVGPAEVYQLLTRECDMGVSTLKGYLNGADPLTETEFRACFEQGSEYYFVGHRLK